MEYWQVFIVVVMVVLPFALLTVHDGWSNDRLTFRGRPTERDWRRQLAAHAPADDAH